MYGSASVYERVDVGPETLRQRSSPFAPRARRCAVAGSGEAARAVRSAGAAQSPCEWGWAARRGLRHLPRKGIHV